MSPRRILILLLCLGFRLTGAAEASGFRYQLLPDPVTGLLPLEVESTDSGLPAGWRFHPVNPNGDFPTGRGSVNVELDPATGRVLETYREGDVEVREPLVLTPDQYNEILTGRTFQRLWSDKSKSKRSVARATPGFGGTGLRFEAPVQLPKIVQKIVGTGAPAIEISGSETITLSGTSDWTVSDYIQTERARQSAFPSLEMKQELNVNLTGSIGDKIKVDVDQSSNVSTTIDNKVKLRYEGNEDDMIRSVELGNTNLSVEGASFRQEGLFGIKTVAKLGNVDLQTIASKQEGKTETARFTPTGELKREIIFDLQYIPRQYFLIADAPINVDYTTLQVWRDDAITSNNLGTTKPGYARLDPNSDWDSTHVTNQHTQGNFDLLRPNEDYDIRDDIYVTGSSTRKVPVLIMRRQLSTSEVLGVTYTYTDENTGLPVTVGSIATGVDSIEVKAIKVRSNELEQANGLYDPSHPFFQTLIYELRNFYDIRGRDIAMETLTLRVRRIDAGQSTNPERDEEGTQYIEIVGLDQTSKPGSDNLNAPDGAIDDQYINPETGIIFFPDAHPFAPDDATFLDFHAQGRKAAGKGILSEDGEPQGRLWNPLVYYSPTTDLQRDVRYYIEAEFKSSTQGFSLGRFDILEGSEQVKVDNIPQQRGKDYNIVYETGEITFTRPPGPNQTISVDYSYAPGFGSTQMTLLGAAASYVPGPNLSITSSILYDSRGAQDKRPKLGEEPARSIIGDLASVVTFRPVWMTKMVNVIPGVRTNSPSTLNIQGHAAVSNPNPNTQGEAYLDDMEGNRETVTASLSRSQWFWSAIPTFEAPLPDSVPGSLPGPPLLVSEHLDLEWYNSRNVKERDLKPVLLDAEGGDNEHQVLELNILPAANDTTGIITPTNWTGLTQSISSVGQDLSKLRFLEIWVNDFHPYPFHTDVRGKLHINFGRISEDAFWDPDTLPNGRLDTEDKNGDTKLDRSPVDEDTGLDGLLSVSEPGYTGTGSDPNGDDYFYDQNRPNDYSRINNMEGNGLGDPAARPDTEDLNRDGFADFQNAYFEAVIDLADTTRFVSVDVARDYAALDAANKLEHDISPLNGWRLYRIPINEEVFRRSSTAASWTNVQHMRLWVNGANERLRIQIGGVELVGNRWLAAAIDSVAAARPLPLQLFVGSRSNKDDAGFYIPPFDPENATGSSAEAREQSLALRFTNLEQGDSLFAFRTSTDAAATGLGWTQYGEIRFWAHAVDPQANQRDLPLSDLEDLRLLCRFGPDTVNYYEYSAPMLPGWNKVVIPMERMSSVKETGLRDITGARYEEDLVTGEVFRAVGNPSFTRIIRTSFGFTRNGPDALSDGEIWINDLRLSGVKRDRGMRGDLSVQASFADVLALNVSYENQDENFVRVTNSANQGTGMKREAASVATTFQLDKIMPTSGVQLPVRFSFARSTDVPKFRTGSDVTLSPARSELESSIQNRQSVDVSYRRTGPRKGIARYTIDAISGGINYTRSGNQSTSSLDSSWAFNASGNYDLPLGGGGLGLLGKRMTISFLPEVIGFNFNWQSTRDLRYSRFLFADRDTDSTVVRSDLKQRLLTLGGNASWTPLSSVRLRFGVRSLRNMLLHEEGYFGWNKGTEIDHSRTIELNYAPKWLSLLQPSLTMNGRYHENSRPELQTLATDSTGLKNVDNTGSARVTATVPFGRFAQRLAPPPGKGNVSYFTPVRAVLSRLQDIQVTFNMERGSAVSRVYGDAGFWFETGFTEARDPSLRESPNSVFTSSRSYTSGANTTFRPIQPLTIDARADHRLGFTDGNFGSRRVLSRTLPDLKGRWLDLHRLLGLENSLSTMSINSGYVVRVEETGPEQGGVEIRTTTTNFQPLLGWDVAWKDGLRANISTSFIDAVSVDHRLNDVTGDRETLNTEIRFTKTYPASRGIRLPFSRNPIRLPNDLNLNLTFQSATDRKVTIRPGSGFPDIVEIDQTRWNVGTQTNYNFTTSISGGFNAAYRATNDRKTSIETRGITLGLNAQFRF